MSQQDGDPTLKPGEKGSQGDFQLNFLFAMGEVKGSLTALRDDFNSFKTGVGKDVADLDARVERLEHRSLWLAGASAATGSFITIIVGILFK